MDPDLILNKCWSELFVCEDKLKYSIYLQRAESPTKIIVHNLPAGMFLGNPGNLKLLSL
jgi:hypothetical protein